MALSSSESALLTQTCENMNVAANTCREVLEMLRSLGNTGVVDIATHNNAQSAHADAKNLAHLDSNGRLDIGEPVIDIPTWTTYPAMALIPGQAMYTKWYEKKPQVTGVSANTVWAAISDGAGAFAARADIASLYDGAEVLAAARDAVNICDASGTRPIGFEYCTGSLSDASNKSHKPTIIRIFGCMDDGSYTYFYSIEGSGIVPLHTSTIGYAAYPFDTAYFRTAATTTSDRREKSGISAIGSEAVDFLKALRPVQFTMKNGREVVLASNEDGNPTNVEIIPGTRRHWGLIAQEVQEALVSAGYDPSACAVWSLADKNDPDSKQALRYEELIAPMIKVIQQQQERIEALERRVA